MGAVEGALGSREEVLDAMTGWWVDAGGVDSVVSVRVKGREAGGWCSLLKPLKSCFAGTMRFEAMVVDVVSVWLIS